MKLNFKKAIIILLFASALLVGFASLFFGIKNTAMQAIKTKDWFETTGYFRDYSVYDIDDGKTTYRLKYVYYAGGAEYFAETDYGSEIIPETDSTRTVLFNPENPAEAIIKGGEGSSVVLTIGIMFTVIPIFMIICWLFVTGKIKLNVKILDFTVGLIMFAIAELFIYIMSGSFWPLSALKSMGIVAVIPLLMVVAGIFQMVKTVFNGIKN